MCMSRVGNSLWILGVDLSRCTMSPGKVLLSARRPTIRFRRGLSWVIFIYTVVLPHGLRSRGVRNVEPPALGFHPKIRAVRVYLICARLHPVREVSFGVRFLQSRFHCVASKSGANRLQLFRGRHGTVQRPSVGVELCQVSCIAPCPSGIHDLGPINRAFSLYYHLVCSIFKLTRSAACIIPLLSCLTGDRCPHDTITDHTHNSCTVPHEDTNTVPHTAGYFALHVRNVSAGKCDLVFFDTVQSVRGPRLIA